MKATKMAAVFLALFLLGGCLEAPTTGQMSREDNIILEVVNQSDATITSIELEWTVDGKATGGQGVAYADGSPLKKGDSFLFELLESDLPAGTDVELTFAVTEPDGTRRALEPALPLQAEYGQIYRYEITGTQAQDLQTSFLSGQEGEQGR